MKPISHYFKRPNATETEVSQVFTETVDTEEAMDEEGDEVLTEAPSSSTAGRKYNFNPQWQRTFPWLIF